MNGLNAAAGRARQWALFDGPKRTNEIDHQSIDQLRKELETRLKVDGEFVRAGDLRAVLKQELALRREVLRNDIPVTPQDVFDDAVRAHYAPEVQRLTGKLPAVTPRVALGLRPTWQGVQVSLTAATRANMPARQVAELAYKSREERASLEAALVRLEGMKGPVPSALSVPDLATHHAYDAIKKSATLARLHDEPNSRLLLEMNDMLTRLRRLPDPLQNPL